MAGFQLTPVEGDPFQDIMALQDYARTLPTPPPAPLDDFGYTPPAAPQPALPGLAGVAGDPSRSMAVRIPAAIGSSLADQGVGLARSAWGAAMLPGDVARGLVDPSSPEAIRRSTDLAGLLTLPAAGKIANLDTMGSLAGAAMSDENKSLPIWDSGWFHGSDTFGGAPSLEHFGTGAFEKIGNPNIIKSYFPSIYLTDIEKHASKYGQVHNMDLDVSGDVQTIDMKERLSDWATEQGYSSAQEMIDKYYDGDVYDALSADQEFSQMARNANKAGNKVTIADFGDLVHDGRFKLGKVAIVNDPSAIRLSPGITLTPIEHDPFAK